MNFFLTNGLIKYEGIFFKIQNSKNIKNGWHGRLLQLEKGRQTKAGKDATLEENRGCARIPRHAIVGELVS